MQIVEEEKLYHRAGCSSLNEWATQTFDRGRSTIHRWRQAGKVVKVIDEDDLEDLHQSEVLELVPLLKTARKSADLKKAVNDVLGEAKSSDEGLSPSSIQAIVEKRLPAKSGSKKSQKREAPEVTGQNSTVLTFGELVQDFANKLNDIIANNEDAEEVERANSLLSHVQGYVS
jgi:hypothetical protein